MMMRATGSPRSGLEDRDGLAFGDDVIEPDQNGFECARGGGGGPGFHLHGLDEGDVVTVADAGAGLDRKRADAPGYLGHNLDLWHFALRDSHCTQSRSRG